MIRHNCYWYILFLFTISTYVVLDAIWRPEYTLSNLEIDLIEQIEDLDYFKEWAKAQ